MQGFGSHPPLSRRALAISSFPAIRSALLGSVAVLSLLGGFNLAAHAADGDGGVGGGNLTAGPAGSASATSAGQAGADGSGTSSFALSAGSGGGSGLTGGAGGVGGGSSPGSGGAGGASTGAAGADGTAGGDQSANGGGGGGAHAYVGGTQGLPLSGTLIGGAGGGGGAVGNTGYGGGGGGGGFGAVVTGLNSSLVTINANATGGAGGSTGRGGTGGSGGSGLVIYQPTGLNLISFGGILSGGAGGASLDHNSQGANGGSALVITGGTGDNIIDITGGGVTGGSGGWGDTGGAGGNGILVENTGGTTTLKIATSVTGGNGGAGTAGDGVGGAGITGANIALAIEATGSVSGGLGGLSATGTALNFVGGFNGLTMATGATLVGGISVQGSSTTLTLPMDSNQSFANAFSGNGTLVKTGIGTLTLLNDNSGFNGAVTVSGGTLALSGAGSLSGAISVTMGAATLDTSGATSRPTLNNLSSSSSDSSVVVGSHGLTLHASNDNLFSGIISGNGDLTVSGNGSLTLTAANTYTGGTIVDGKLTLAASGSITGDITVNPHGTLVFARTGTNAIQQAIHSTSFTTVVFKNGTYSYSGAGIIEGDVRVEAGTLRLLSYEFSEVNSLTIGAGGILSGSGQASNILVENGGVFAANTAVNGTLTFNSGSIFRVEVRPSGAPDVIIASGPVTINGGTVQVVAVPGQYARNNSYPIIITTSTLTGTFDGVTSDYAFLTPTLSYDTQSVYLTLVYPEPSAPSFATFAQTRNQIAVANAAQTLGQGNAVFDALLQQSTSSAPAAFNALSGEAYASTGTVIQQQAVYMREAMGARLMQSLTAPGVSPLAYGAGPQTAALGEGLTPTLWAQGYGGWGNSFSNGNAASISNNIGGFLLGLDVALAPNVRAGLFGGFSQSQFDATDRSSTGSMNNVDLGVYAGAQFGAFALRGGASYTWHDVSMNRTVAFPGFSQAVEGGYNTGTTQVFGEIGYDVALGAYAFEPFAGLAYVHVAGASLQESGGSAGLAVSTSGMDTVYSTLGLRVATTLQVWGSTLTPHATVGWQHAFGDTTPTSTMQFLGGTTPFSVSGVPIAEDAVQLQAGLTYALSPKVNLGATYTSQLASTAAQNAFTAQFSLKF